VSVDFLVYLSTVFIYFIISSFPIIYQLVTLAISHLHLPRCEHLNAGEVTCIHRPRDIPGYTPCLIPTHLSNPALLLTRYMIKDLKFHSNGRTSILQTIYGENRSLPEPPILTTSFYNAFSTATLAFPFTWISEFVTML